MANQDQESLEQLARGEQPSLAAEFIDFLKHNKKWWLTPILIVIALVGALAALGGSGAAPFIYPMF